VEKVELPNPYWDWVIGVFLADWDWDWGLGFEGWVWIWIGFFGQKLFKNSKIFQ
jgi:hypothetical protein